MSCVPNLVLPLLALLLPFTDSAHPPPHDITSGVTIAGVVRAENGAPLAGALVLMTRLDPALGAMSYSMRRSTVSDPSGRFSFAEVEKSSWLLDARDETRWLPLPLQINTDRTDILELKLHLEQATAIEGVVVDKAGAPIASAVISIGDGGMQGGEIDPVSVLLHPSRERRVLPTSIRYPRLPLESVVSDEEGRFRIAPLLPSIRTTLRATGVPPFLDHTLRGETGAAGHATPMKIELERGATISGNVFDEAGRPLPGAKVGLFVVESINPEEGARWLVLTRDSPRFLGARDATRQYADADGGFLLEGLLTGRYRVSANVPGRDVIWSSIVDVRNKGDAFSLTVSYGDVPARPRDP